MNDTELTSEVEGEDPCGPDLRWDSEWTELAQAFHSALASVEGAVVGAERSDGRTVELARIGERAAALARKTKDVRIAALYAEVRWREAGLGAFATAMEALAAMIERWPDPDTGVHPRADEEDGDLGERAAALGKLLHGVPALVDTVAWGRCEDPEERARAARALDALFERWSERLGPAFGPDLPSPEPAREALEKLTGGLGHEAEAPAGGAEHAGGEESGARARPRPDPHEDAWDTVERAHARMQAQNSHSPAVPLLRLIARWRDKDLSRIATELKMGGLPLEQLLEAVERQLDPPQ